MGDARNKVRRFEHRDRLAQSAQHYLTLNLVAELNMPRCRCGFTWHDVPTMWQFTGSGLYDPLAGIYCAKCLPDKIAQLYGIGSR